MSAANGAISVSIPKRVSAKVEHAVEEIGTDGLFRFQSLKGFQPRWNDSYLGIVKDTIRFNP